MLKPKQVSGTWTGRLIDIRGYEGEISLQLTGRRGAVHGSATAAIGATHESERWRLKLSGEYGDDRVQLSGMVDEETGPEISLDVTIFELAGGGEGMRGTYKVSPRKFSALRTGVISASKGELIRTTEVRPELVLQRRESAGGKR
jgi:hypothetical protein